MKSHPRLRTTVLVFAGLTVALCAGWFYIASSTPDGLERVAARLGFAQRATTTAPSPMIEYEFSLLGSRGAGRAVAALLGSALCFLAAWGIGRYSAQRKKRLAPGPARSLE